MKYAPLLIALFVAIVVFGCGGGSGSGGTTSTSTTGTTTTTTGDTLELAVIAESSPGVQVDPTNLQVGDSVTFHLAQLDLTKDTFVVQTSGGFTTTDTAGAAGTLNAQTGYFTATKSTAGKTYTISTASGGKTYSAPYAVTPVQARVTGVVQDSNGAPVQFAVVGFFDSSSNQVGSTTTTITGTFNGSVPLTGAGFNLIPGSFSIAEYYSAFSYGTGSYGPLIKGCNAPLPALASGKTASLPNAVILSDVTDSNGVQNTPPPPPSCSQ